MFDIFQPEAPINHYINECHFHHVFDSAERINFTVDGVKLLEVIFDRSHDLSSPLHSQFERKTATALGEVTVMEEPADSK